MLRMDMHAETLRELDGKNCRLQSVQPAVALRGFGGSAFAVAKADCCAEPPTRGLRSLFESDTSIDA